MGLKEKIINISPRENSGATTSNRFDFQKNWALCKILELHEEKNDYLVTFEFHEDIIIFDSSQKPMKASFYQIKTKKGGNWTINALTKRKKGEKEELNSIIGKLFENWIKFGENVETLNFVSNSSLKVKLKNPKIKSEDRTEIWCCEISARETQTVMKKIEEEFKEFGESESLELYGFTDVFYFKMGELDINHHSTIAKGKLSEFIDSYLPNVSYKISPLYKSIFDEIRRKSNYENHVNSFEELKQKKSISKNDFDKYILELNQKVSFKDLGKKIEERLNVEGCPLSFVLSFPKYWDKLEIGTMNYDDKVFQKLVKKIEELVKKIKKDGRLKSRLVDSLELLFDEVKTNINTEHCFEDDYIKTMILWVLYETG